MWIELDPLGARLGHATEVAVRIGGSFVSTRVDLLHGDRLELGEAGVRFEVE